MCFVKTLATDLSRYSRFLPSVSILPRPFQGLSHLPAEQTKLWRSRPECI